MENLSRLDGSSLAQLQSQLGDETLLWAGQPSPDASFRQERRSWWMGVPFTAFALVWEGLAFQPLLSAQEGAVPGVLALLFPLFGLPFVLVGLWMLARPFLAARRARRTVHVLTRQRLVSAVFEREGLMLTSITPGEIVSLSSLARGDGSGDLDMELGAEPGLLPGPGGHEAPMPVALARRVRLAGVPEVAALVHALEGLRG